MNKLVAILFGLVLTFSAIRYAIPESYKGYAHVCTTGSKLCPSETPLITVITPIGMTCSGKTSTTTSTSTATGTAGTTFYQSPTQPVLCTVVGGGGTLTGTNGISFITGTGTATSTMTGTLSGSATATMTGTLPSTQTTSFTGTRTATNNYSGVNVPYTWTDTGTSTSRAVSVTETYSNTVTGTVTVTGTKTLTQSGVATGTITVTAVGTFTNTDGGTGTATMSATSTATTVTTGTHTASVTVSATATASSTASGSATNITGVTVTGTGTGIFFSTTFNLTATLTSAATATGSFTGTGTGTGTATASASGTVTVTTTSISSGTATTATLPTTITYTPPAVPVIGGDLFLGFNGANIVSFNPYPTDSGDIAKTLSAGGAAQDVVPGDGGYGYQCEGTGTHFCTVVANTTSAPKWVSPGTVTVALWAKSTSSVTLKMTVGMYNGFSLTSTLFVASWTVSSASWTQFTTSYSIVNGIYVGGSPTGIAAEFTAQDAGAGTPTVTIGVASPHRFYINGPWVASGAKP